MSDRKMVMFDPPHPGECLRETARMYGMTVTEAARKLGVSRVTLSGLLHGRQRLTAAVAVRIESIGWGDAEFWLRLQTQFDLAAARRKAA